MPGDWAGLKEAVTKVNEKTGQFGFGYDAKGVQAFRYFGFFLRNNGGDFDADGKAAFNSATARRARRSTVDLAGTKQFRRRLRRSAIEDLEPMFKSGRLAMLIDGNCSPPLSAAMRRT